MLRILFIYSKTNNLVSYRQGMHELLAPIIYLLHQEVTDYKKNEESIALHDKQQALVDTIYDKQYMEHDAYMLFHALMKYASNWFGVTSTGNALAPFTSSSSSSTSQSPQSLQAQTKQAPKLTFSLDQETQSEEAKATVVNEAVIKCKKINKILKKHDPALHYHLEALGIEPQIYLLRWIRLLFGREFHLDDVITMWDSLFAYGEDLILIDYVSVSMLTYIRDQLIDKDNGGVLQRLFKYPPVEDVTSLIQRAFRIKDTVGDVNNDSSSISSASISIGTASALDQEPANSPSSMFTPFNFDPLKHNPVMPSSGPSTTGAAAPKTAPAPQPTRPTIVPTPVASVAKAKPLPSSNLTAIYGESLFSMSSSSTPSTTNSLTAESKFRSTNLSSGDLFGASKSEAEPLGFFTTSVNLSTARSNYFNSQPTVPPTKNSFITSKSSVNTEIKKLRNLQRYIGNSLADLVPTLQAGFSDNPSLNRHEQLSKAVSMVNHFKDMLLGDIPIPENIPEIPEAETEDPLSSK
ncbi:hypothetical protein SAMD00019534_125370 [Acytostelium subglobosum LB1]|uniref:hypothetical protein n=1 Tax=Acytostelium subglobosum LB1 TaxID=1410327 RepID=UPI000644C339|nr:hypothetical protein SAMD00019534_125370 [Acytostelium subglobosum LB1]GAM29361.1 hypothetical protein SAMD00019534_125370 [Acytostelium subglobosum LB1]|eukprot:XP_012747692.1 hypothetical protein SAMD00019534_125370 [Acytostelium subglobosum LB1]